MGKQEKQQESKPLPPLPFEVVQEFCKKLSPDHRTIVAMSIVNTVRLLGCSETRTGSAIWEKARAVVVSDMIRKEADLDECAGDMLEYLHGSSDDEKEAAARRDYRKRVIASAEFLRDEAGAPRVETGIYPDDDDFEGEPGFTSVESTSRPSLAVAATAEPSKTQRPLLPLLPTDGNGLQSVSIDDSENSLHESEMLQLASV